MILFWTKIKKETLGFDITKSHSGSVGVNQVMGWSVESYRFDRVNIQPSSKGLGSRLASHQVDLLGLVGFSNYSHMRQLCSFVFNPILFFLSYLLMSHDKMQSSQTCLHGCLV